eukprot:2060524-Amphidinium_carterae.1
MSHSATSSESCRIPPGNVQCRTIDLEGPDDSTIVTNVNAIQSKSRCYNPVSTFQRGQTI